MPSNSVIMSVRQQHSYILKGLYFLVSVRQQHSYIGLHFHVVLLAFSLPVEHTYRSQMIFSWAYDFRCLLEHL